jgi:predicted PhzF superfamily epimerase YddE/YHI9
MPNAFFIRPKVIAGSALVLPPRKAKADRRLRSFTPKAEVFGIGHHTLGAWWALAARGGLDLRDPETKFGRRSGRACCRWPSLPKAASRCVWR